ncbi:MAG TPA: tripartite tricarboxylate transporter substrate binding protein [Burkholderiales bacterium]|nr:tripartite tricarboxylate transporter substrate binding protein [Burkholderiales bacterium]
MKAVTGYVLASMCVFYGPALQAADTLYPDRPVRMMVPFPPGGANDIVARLVAQKLSERWSKPVVIDNRAGAGGNIGTEVGARANPDGYTLTIGSTSTYCTNVVLDSKLPFDPRRDFATISLIVTAPNIMVTHPSVPAATVPEFIKYAKANPKRLNFSSFGDGSSAHLVGEMFKSAAGVSMVHVPYKGGGPALAAVMGGEVQLTFSNLSVALPQVKGGKVKGIAVTSAKRATALPDLPTIAESGLPGFEAIASVGIMAPAGTTRALVSRVNRDVHAVVSEAVMKEQFISRGLEIALSTPEEFARYMRTEIERWGRVVREAGIPVK